MSSILHIEFPPDFEQRYKAYKVKVKGETSSQPEASSHDRRAQITAIKRGLDDGLKEEALINKVVKKITHAGDKELFTPPFPTKPSFDENSGKIIWNDNECSIPLNTNQYFFCKKMFGVPFGTRVKEMDILNMIDWDKDSKRSVYDAMRAVNAKILNDFGVKELFEWRNNHTWIRQELFG